ncbi:MAG: CTB family bacteriocin [Pelatocladus maniniholoensis HA4357-MV3]|jgi:hypothetical protein|uniref:CTB family bacteriocin n=1 Tax=Pelatocladus maniniholoensis HA4357-MV3 TaxID=1117104 RepID=A0A9E3H9F8_9NOST|nr:CTB family bacteriocin [Pelatocladus maniniholoensis HA4357-MV3]BAZ65527.1 hypothetical protein NIES4106_02660 [Fischerella sp. NIES-4106]
MSEDTSQEMNNYNAAIELSDQELDVVAGGFKFSQLAKTDFFKKEIIIAQHTESRGDYSSSDLFIQITEIKSSALNEIDFDSNNQIQQS